MENSTLDYNIPVVYGVRHRHCRPHRDISYVAFRARLSLLDARDATLA